MAGEDRLGAVYSVALSLGLRLGEALGLKWSDVDLADRTITIERAVQRVSGKGLQFVPVKTDRTVRKIKLPARLYSHVFPSALGDAADAMDRALGGQFGGQPDQATGRES